MGRSLQAYVAVSALLGLSGCLLFTDPINRAPEVTDVRALSDKVLRGKSVDFIATFNDDSDSPRDLDIQWAVFDVTGKNCDSITKASWEGASTQQVTSDELYEFETDMAKPVCVCARARDHHGASGFGCAWVEPQSPELIAKIADLTSIPAGGKHRLCSSIHLSAEPSSFVLADQPQFDWRMEYSGTDPEGSTVKLVECETVEDGAAMSQHRCFYAGAPGTYTVHMSITATPVGGGETVKSNEAEIVIPVDVDRPPCLQQTTPDVYSQLVMLSTYTDLGASFESRTFKVWSVDDDCEPYPQAPGKEATQFVWSVYDERRDSQWVYQTNSGDTFLINHTMFPDALPGDEIKVRVEVRDKAVQEQYLSHVYPCDSEQVDRCIDAEHNECIRWTTWTVQFQP